MVGMIIKHTMAMIIIAGSVYVDGYIKGFAEGHKRGSGLTNEEYLQSKLNQSDKVRNFMNDYETFREGIGA